MKQAAKPNVQRGQQAAGMATFRTRVAASPDRRWAGWRVWPSVSQQEPAQATSKCDQPQPRLEETLGRRCGRAQVLQMPSLKLNCQTKTESALWLQLASRQPFWKGEQNRTRNYRVDMFCRAWFTAAHDADEGIDGLRCFGKNSEDDKLCLNLNVLRWTGYRPSGSPSLRPALFAACVMRFSTVCRYRSVDLYGRGQTSQVVGDTFDFERVHGGQAGAEDTGHRSQVGERGVPRLRAHRIHRWSSSCQGLFFLWIL